MNAKQHANKHASGMMRLVTSVLVLCLLGSLVGCKKPRVSINDVGVIELKGKVPKGPVPSYESLAKKYNERVAAIPQFSSQAQIEIVYHDSKGKRHLEQADQGRVIMLLPDHMAVLVRKFGIGDLFLAGSDAQNYWLFDLTDKDHRVLYEGRKVNGAVAAAVRLPVPVQPRDLPTLMGLEALPLDQGKGKVTAVRGGYLLTPQSGGWRVVVDEKTALPLRVDLTRDVLDDPSKAVLSRGKRVYMTSLLSMPERLETQGIGRPAWPLLMKRIELRPTDSKDYLVVHLSGVANDGDLDADSRAFDFTRLKKTYKPDEVVDLDQQD